MPGVATRLSAEGANFEGEMIRALPLAGWPAPGDLWADDRVSSRTFVVVNRFFHWDENGDLLYQLLLDLPAADEEPFKNLPRVAPPNYLDKPLDLPSQGPASRQIGPKVFAREAKHYLAKFNNS